MGIQRFKGQCTSTHPSDETSFGQIIQNPSDGYVSGAHHPRQVGYSDYALSKKCVEDQLSSLRREPSCRRGSFGKDLSAGFFPVLLYSPLLVQTALVSMVLLVEYPRVRIRKVLVNGLLLSVRRWYMLVLSLAVLAGYSWGLMRSPILVALLATGLIWYMAWAAVRWQAEPFVRQMARESGDPGVQATYGLPDDGAKGSSFTALQDYRQ